MSVPDESQASKLLAPMKGALTVFLLHDAESREHLSRCLLGCAGVLSIETTVLDTDAYFASNMDLLVGKAPAPTGQLMTLPEGGLEVSSLVPLLSSKTAMLLVDDLNSLYSLAAGGARQLGALMRMFSYNARLNGTWAVATAYMAELEERRTPNPRSVVTAGDVLVDTQMDGETLKLTWPDGAVYFAK